MAKKKKSDSVYRVVDVVGVSDKSWEDAGRRAVDTAAGSLRDLRVEYRTAFVLYHQHGQPYEEIALALDHPVGTIKTWLHRARMQVLEQLRNRGMVPEEYRM